MFPAKCERVSSLSNRALESDAAPGDVGRGRLDPVGRSQNSAMDGSERTVNCER
jgi:hypothetical protein